MYAYQMKSPGTQPVLEDIAPPAPGPGQVLLTIKACGLNFADILMQNGSYQEIPPTPFTLGMELSGIVTDVGESVDDPSIDDRVAVFSGQGGLAQQGVFDADRIVKLPDTMSFEHGAAFQIAMPPVTWLWRIGRVCKQERLCW